MTRWVVDASVVVPFLMEEELTPLAFRFLSGGHLFSAPRLLKLEVASAVWKSWRRTFIDQSEAAGLMERFEAMSIVFPDATHLGKSALELALETDHPVYDCEYLAQAIADDCLLVTADKAFLKSVGKTRWADRAVHLSDALSLQ